MIYRWRSIHLIVARLWCIVARFPLRIRFRAAPKDSYYWPHYTVRPNKVYIMRLYASFFPPFSSLRGTEETFAFVPDSEEKSYPWCGRTCELAEQVIVS